MSDSKLKQAYALIELGDVVQARATLAQVDVASEVEKKAAEELSKTLSSTEGAVAITPEAVAQHLGERATPPEKAYWFTALCLGVFALLVLLYRSRYAS